MSNSYDYDYAEISVPYNQLLERGGENIGVGAEDISTEGQPSSVGDANTLTGSSFNDLWIDSWIKSRSYKPKSQGFMIDGRLGYIECMQLYVGNGGIVGGSLDVPNKTSDNSWHVDSSGNMWSGCNVADFTADNDNANAYILNTGVVKLQNAIISGGANVQFISDTLDTSAQKILKDFSLDDTDYAGALKAGDIAWDTTTGRVTSGTGFVINDKGIMGALDGDETVSILNDGTATFAGTLASPNGILGIISAGTIYGTTIKTSNITYPKVLIDSSGITIHGPDIYFKKADGTDIGIIDPSSTVFNIRTAIGIPLTLQTQGNANLNLTAGTGDININSDLLNTNSYITNLYIDDLYDRTAGFITTHQNLIPNSTYDLGSSSKRWGVLYTTSINASAGATFGNNISATSSTYTLGLSGGRWGNVYSVDGNFSGDITCDDITADQVDMNTLNDRGSGISVASHLYPTAGYDIGSSSNRWDEIYATSLNLTGDITCDDINGDLFTANKLHLTPGTSNPTSAGDITNYSSGGTEQFRGRPGNGSWVGSFDMTAY